MVRIGWSGASAPAWKSIEWPMLPSLTRVISKTSPTLPCSVGPGAVPSKVQSVLAHARRDVAVQLAHGERPAMDGARRERWQHRVVRGERRPGVRP